MWKNMQMKKNENGITLIALAVMMIVMLIILSVTTYSGISSVKESGKKKLTSELQIVQHAVLEVYTKYQIFNDISYLVGDKIQSVNDIPAEYKNSLKEKDSAFLSNNRTESSYYKLDESKLKDIGVEESNYEYIVCYKTGEVMNITVKKTSDGKLLYTSFE